MKVEGYDMGWSGGAPHVILRARPMYLSVTDVPTVVRKRGGQDQSVVLPSPLYVRAIPERGGNTMWD